MQKKTPQTRIKVQNSTLKTTIIHKKNPFFFTHTRCCETQPPLFSDLSEIENIPNSENVGSARIFKIKKTNPAVFENRPEHSVVFFFFLKFQKHFGTCKNSKYEIRPNCRFRGYCQFAFRR